MKYFEAFTGIGGFSLGMKPEFECVGFSEVDRFCSQVLKYRFPNVINFGDISKIDWTQVEDFDLFCGGWPCQDLSRAGKAEGIHGPKSSLFFEVIRALKEKNPPYFLLENVSDIIELKNGDNFRIFAEEITEIGYDFQWQIINAKDSGYPLQRRRFFSFGFHRNRSEDFGEIVPFGENDEVYGKASSGIFRFLAADNRKFQRNSQSIVNQTFRLLATDYKGACKQRDRMIVGQENRFRLLAPTEREQIAGFPKDWTKYGTENGKETLISNKQRFKMTGNMVPPYMIKALINKYL